jgi:hypothetical protein
MRRKHSPLIDVERADKTERTGHSTTKQIRPVKISKKHMAAQLVYAAAGAAAHALARVFGAQQLDEILSFLGNAGRKFLKDHESVTGNQAEVIENVQQQTQFECLQYLHVKCGCKRLRESELETECGLHEKKAVENFEVL